jgi:Na+/H+ antiporter NhaD/arsenite permease-like protein
MIPTIRVLFKKAALYARKEPFLIITFLVTVSFSVYSKPNMNAVHWNVIATLFSLMLVSLAFERCMLLTSLAYFAMSIVGTPRKLGMAMILVTGILAMFLTNDVALLTVVPLTITMAKVSDHDPYLLIILETMSANLFSALTPFGNPQNLYLYSYYHMMPADFFAMMIPFCLFGATLIAVTNLLFHKGSTYEFDRQPFRIENRKLLYGATAVFVCNVLSILRLIDYKIVLAATLFVFLCLAPKLFRKVDYSLLVTFILFFLFTDSVSGIPIIQSVLTSQLDSKLMAFFVSAGLSQIISNVPAAVLVSGFTPHAREVLYGVSAGGLGTVIASLASLISYKLYARDYHTGQYLRSFYAFNFCILFILILATMGLEVTNF